MTVLLQPGWASSVQCSTILVHGIYTMRDEKEGRKKQARSNKQGKATQHTHVSNFSFKK